MEQDYSPEATELRLWADNDGASYKRSTGPALANIAKKMHNLDTYSAAKASQFLADVLKDAAKTYEAEFMLPGQWKSVFPRWVRLEAADAMLASLWAEVELGNYDQVTA